MTTIAKDVEIQHATLAVSNQFEKNIDLDNRIIRVTGEINEDTFRTVDAGMTLMEKANRKGITIRINSDGGEIYHALAVVGRMTKPKEIRVVTEGYGHVMSAATLILAAGDVRLMSKYAWFMHHEFRGGIEGSLTEQRNHITQLYLEWDAWCGVMADFSNKDKAWWKKLADGGQDIHMTAEEMLEHGVINKIF